MQDIIFDSEQQKWSEEMARRGYMSHFPFRSNEQVEWPMFLDRVYPVEDDIIPLDDDDFPGFPSNGTLSVRDASDELDVEIRILKKEIIRLSDEIFEKGHFTEATKMDLLIARMVWTCKQRYEWDSCAEATLDGTDRFREEGSESARMRYFLRRQGGYKNGSSPSWYKCYKQILLGKMSMCSPGTELLLETARYRGYGAVQSFLVRTADTLFALQDAPKKFVQEKYAFHALAMSDLDAGYKAIGRVGTVQSCFLKSTVVTRVDGRGREFREVEGTPFVRRGYFTRFRIVSITVEGCVDESATFRCKGEAKSSTQVVRGYFKLYYPISDFSYTPYLFTGACAPVGSQLSRYMVVESDIPLTVSATVVYEFQGYEPSFPFEYLLLPDLTRAYWLHPQSVRMLRCVSKGWRSLFYSCYQGDYRDERRPLTALTAAYNSAMGCIGRPQYTLWLPHFHGTGRQNKEDWFSEYRAHFFSFLCWQMTVSAKKPAKHKW